MLAKTSYIHLLVFLKDAVMANGEIQHVLHWHMARVIMCTWYMGVVLNKVMFRCLRGIEVWNGGKIVKVRLIERLHLYYLRIAAVVCTLLWRILSP